MPSIQSLNGIDSKTVENWIQGWSVTREVSPPIPYKSGFKVNVGWPKQLVRYVFPRLEDDFFDLANTIYSPWHFLKVCASPTELIQHIPSRWKIQTPRFLMTCYEPMALSKKALPETYTLLEVNEDPIRIAKVVTEREEVAAIGRIVL
jgi:hypothetical protein